MGFFDYFRKKKFAILYRRVHGTPQLIKSFRIKNPAQNTVIYGDLEFFLDQEKPTYVTIKGDAYFFIDIKHNCQADFKTVQQIDPRIVKMLLEGRMVRAMSDSLKTDVGLSVETKSLLIGAGLGGTAVATVLLTLIILGVF